MDPTLPDMWVVIYYQEGARREAISGPMSRNNALDYVKELTELPGTIRACLERARPDGRTG